MAWPTAASSSRSCSHRARCATFRWARASTS